MDHPWIRQNVEWKEAQAELLTVTASRDHRLQATWLDPVTGRQEPVAIAVSQERFPSLTPWLPEVAWDEREIHDVFGYIPEGHPDLRPLIRTPRWPHNFRPLRDRPHPRPVWQDVEPDNPGLTVDGDGVTIMKVGPTHAGVIESGHFVFSLMGENVLHLDAHLFQNHRGLESLLEGQTVDTVGAIVTRICAADTVSHQTNWAFAVEALAGYEAGAALTLGRILLLESERVLSHLNDLAQIPAGVGFQVAHQQALAIKEDWQRGLQRLYGHRFLFDTVRPGWVAPVDPEDLLRLVHAIRRPWTPWRRLVEGHHGFNDRMAGVGVTTRAEVVRFGAQGVVARAAGKAFDARTLLPLYQDLRPVPVVEIGGDVRARFYVRIHELEASLRLIEQAAVRLRRQTAARDARWRPPDAVSGQVVVYTESPHGLNVHDVAVDRGRVSRYHVRAATYRNWPLLAHAVPGNAVADFPLINKSFELCYSCTDR